MSLTVGRHWSEGITEIVLSINPKNSDFCPFTVGGGSENALFPYVSQLQKEKLTYLRAGNGERMTNEDILLEIQGRKIVGLTSYDAQRWLVQCCQRGGPLSIKFVKSGLLTKDLRQYLGMRFPKSSIDHDLQSTIRDNVYLKTVPCTTRFPRSGEIDGVDYRFVTREDFDALERHGELLESGIFEGNYYGTPKPPKLEENELDQNNLAHHNIIKDNAGGGSVVERRRRNRTDLGDMAPLFVADVNSSASTANVNGGVQQQQQQHQNPSTSTVLQPTSFSGNGSVVGGVGETNGYHGDDGLGPLPPNWEIACTEAGEKYFIDHNSGTTHWTDPRLRLAEQRPSVSSSSSDLPYGWEKVEDPQYGTYYVDHVNKRTQYEKPSMSANEYIGGAGSSSSVQNPVISSVGGGNFVGAFSPRRVNSVPDFATRKQIMQSPHKGYFTRNPNELRGELISTRLIKSAKGLGFTLVGNDGSSGDEELLQIKNIIPGGPAYRDGRLRMGDVLVYVNDNCVLGFKQDEIIRLFQSVSVGMPVGLQVCRGYPLLFDPTDPTNDFVTQDAYSISESDTSTGVSDLNLRPDTVNAHIVKGDLGFGFTITDCAYGQKVKSIIDKQRCQNLLEGDILVEINGRNVRKMSHADIVEVFRDCPIGQKANIVCQRYNSGTLKRSQTEGNGYASRPPAVPAKPVSRPTVHNQNESGRPHSYHPGYNNVQSNSKFIPSVTSAHGDVSNYGNFNNQDFSSTNPSVKPRSKTPGPAPPRPTKANGFLPEHYQQQQQHGSGMNIANHRPPTAHYNSKPQFGEGGVPIYENLPGKDGRAQNLVNGGLSSLNISNPNDSSISPSQRNRSKSPGGARPKTPSSSFFASATPNYVPASVYTAGKYENSKTSQVYNNFDQQRSRPVAIGSVYQSQTHLPPNGHHQSQNNYQSSNGHGNQSQSHLSSQPQQRYQYVTANLIRRADGFGFRILGGIEEGTQTSVGHIVPGGAAEQDGRLRMHDEIVEIDGQSTLGVAHKTAVDLLRIAASNGHVKLVTRREIVDLPRSASMPIPRQPRPYPYDVTIIRRENEGFGFIIISSPLKRFGSQVGQIVPGSPAARCAQLKVGDYIIAVNGIDILKMDHGQIVHLIKDSGYTVTLTVGHHEDPNANAPPAQSYPSFANVVPNPNESTLNTPQQRQSLVSLMDLLDHNNPQFSELLEYDAIDVSEPPSPVRSRRNGSIEEIANKNVLSDELPLTVDEEYFAVELNRGAKGFGFSIRGGKEFSNMDLFVLRIAEAGPAFLDGRLHVGDQLIEINGVSTVGMSHADAIDLIKREPTVRLLVRRHPNPPVDISTVSTTPSLESPYGRLNGSRAPLAIGETLEHNNWSRNR